MMQRWHFIAFMILLFAPGQAQENSFTVDFAADARKNSVIAVFRRDGATYGSLSDLARVFSLVLHEDRSLQKCEIAQPPYRLGLTAGNPFVTVIDDSGRRTLYQLGGNAVRMTTGYFVPLATFTNLLNNVFSRGITYDERARSLRVGLAVSKPVYDIGAPRVQQKSNGMIIRIPAGKHVKDVESWLQQDGWLYVTLPDVKGNIAAINGTKPLGFLRQVVAIQSPNSLQLSFKLSGTIASSEVTRPEGSHDLVVTIRTKSAEEAREEKLGRQMLEGLEHERSRWGLDVIVIDAGHGGKDWGAIGVTGVREKDITLGISLKLGKLLEKGVPGVKVVYTRKSDKFIELDRRGQAANEADGKLFISIHCNSLKRKPSPTRGFEVYLLRPGRTNEAVTIAERENAVIQMEEGFEKRYQELTEENFILVTMAQSAHVKASEVFADIAQQEMRGKTGIPNRGVRQAGFYVLVGAAMPNVLVEAAYLSNREDERFLKSDAGQQKVAESLFNAVKRYKSEYEKLLLEGREIGER